MTPLHFRLSDDVLKDFPDMEVRALRVRGLAAAAAKASSADLIDRASDKVANTLTQEALMADPRIVAWREAYRRIGAKPSQYRSSIEALARRAVKKAGLAINIPPVDIYNAVSLMNLAPLGAYDRSRLPEGDMEMRRVNPAIDSFTPLGAKATDFPLQQNLVVYAMGSKVLCWGFNCRDSVDTCLTAKTNDGVFFGEAVFPEHQSALREAFEKLKAIFTEAGASCGEVQTANCAKSAFTV